MDTQVNSQGEPTAKRKSRSLLLDLCALAHSQSATPIYQDQSRYTMILEQLCKLYPEHVLIKEALAYEQAYYNPSTHASSLIAALAEHLVVYLDPHTFLGVMARLFLAKEVLYQELLKTPQETEQSDRPVHASALPMPLDTPAHDAVPCEFLAAFRAKLSEEMLSELAYLLKLKPKLGRALHDLWRSQQLVLKVSLLLLDLGWWSTQSAWLDLCNQVNELSYKLLCSLPDCDFGALTAPEKLDELALKELIERARAKRGPEDKLCAQAQVTTLAPEDLGCFLGLYADSLFLEHNFQVEQALLQAKITLIEHYGNNLTQEAIEALTRITVDGLIKQAVTKQGKIKLSFRNAQYLSHQAPEHLPDFIQDLFLDLLAYCYLRFNHQ